MIVVALIMRTGWMNKTKADDDEGKKDEAERSSGYVLL